MEFGIEKCSMFLIKKEKKKEQQKKQKIQTDALLKSSGILIRVLEFRGKLLSLRLREKFY